LKVQVFREQGVVAIKYISATSYKASYDNVKKILEEEISHKRINFKLVSMNKCPKVTTTFNCIDSSATTEELNKFNTTLKKEIKNKLGVDVSNDKEYIHSMIYDMKTTRLTIYLTYEVYKKMVIKLLNDKEDLYKNIVFSFTHEKNTYNLVECMQPCNRCKKYHDLFEENPDFAITDCKKLCQLCDETSNHTHEKKEKNHKL